MSGIYIPGMEMPNSCTHCRFAVDGWCYAYGKPNIDALANDGRTNFCPLIPVSPHGRLIDADIAEVISYPSEDSDGDFADGILFAADWIAAQPTIIPADKGGQHMTHRIKLSHHYADAVLSGQKNFEIRYNDRGYQRGDKVVFTVVDDCKITMSHPLNREVFIITYLVHGYGLEKDWCVFGIIPADKDINVPNKPNEVA